MARCSNNLRNTQYVQQFTFIVAVRLTKPGLFLLVCIPVNAGIGINASMFSILRGVLLKPLPYPGADRLVRIRAVRDKGERLSTVDFHAIKQIPSFANTALYREDVADIKTPAGPVSAAVAYSEGDLFDVLGIRLLRGHTFSTIETRDVIVSYRFWKDELGGDDSVLGRSITVDREPYRVIGVAPQDFAFPSSQTMLWLHCSPADIAGCGPRRSEGPGSKASGKSVWLPRRGFHCCFSQFQRVWSCCSHAQICHIYRCHKAPGE
jgi:hypothetical protein